MGPIGQQFKPVNLNLGSGQGTKFGAGAFAAPTERAGGPGDELTAFKTQFASGVDLTQPAAPTSLGIGNRLNISG